MYVLKLQVRDRQYKVPLLNKNQDLEVPGVDGGGEPLPSVGGLEDPDYYGESDFSEDEAPAALRRRRARGPLQSPSIARWTTTGRAAARVGAGGRASRPAIPPCRSRESSPPPYQKTVNRVKRKTR